VQDRDRLTQSFVAFARSMTESYDLADALDRLSRALTDVLGITGVGISVVDPDGLLRYTTASNEVVTAIEIAQESAQAGPCYEAFATHRTVIVPDVDERPDWAEFNAAAHELGLRSVAGVPITIRRDVLGAVNLYHDELRPWPDEDIEIARVHADMVAGYLLHASLEASRKLTDQLQYALDSRVVIEQAKGLLAGELGIGLDEAFDLLRRHVRGQGLSLRDTAQAVVEQGYRPPGPDPR
jgi:GAF domain-containing protein